MGPWVPEPPWVHPPVPFSPPDLTSGVHTSDILTVYISAIKALRELDPSMVILQVACQPIRKYLRSVHLPSHVQA